MKLLKNDSNQKMKIILKWIAILLCCIALVPLFTIKGDSQWQNDSEALVLGRVYAGRFRVDRNSRFLRVIGILASDYENSVLTDQNRLYGDYPSVVLRAYDLFKNDTEGVLTVSKKYTSSLGWQGEVYSVVDKIANFFKVPYPNRLTLFYNINVLLFVICLVAIAYWFYNEFGMAAAVAIILGFAASPWIMRSAQNLYWVLWASLLPFAAISIVCQKFSEHKYFKYILCAVTFLTVLFKCGCGYELLSTLLISTELPIIYYWIKGKEKKKWFSMMVLVGISGVLAFGISLCLWFFALNAFYNDSDKAWQLVQQTIYKRTGVFKINVAGRYFASLATPKMEVVKEYINSTDLFIGNAILKNILVLHVISAFVSIAVFYRNKEKFFKYIALSVTGFIAFVGSLSWIYLAAPHALVHIAIIQIVWFLPYAVFALAAIGVAIESVFVKKNYKDNGIGINT